MPDTVQPEIATACDHLHSDCLGADTMSYTASIGANRIPAVLLNELPSAAGHELPFCRPIHHTSPVSKAVAVLRLRNPVVDPVRSQVLLMSGRDAPDALESDKEFTGALGDFVASLPPISPTGLTGSSASSPTGRSAITPACNGQTAKGRTTIKEA